LLQVQGVRRTRASKKGIPKKWLFYRYWLFSVKTLADRRRHAAYHNERWWYAF